MSSTFRSKDPHALGLHRSGLELRTIIANDAYSQLLDDALITVDVRDGGTLPMSYYATAQLGPMALGGFGALLGKSDEIMAVFPEGTTFELKERADGAGTTISIGTQDDATTVRGIADGYPNDEGEIFVLPRGKAESVDPDLLAILEEPSLLASAGSYTLALASRAHTLSLAAQAGLGV